jgi:hypothetical protein
MRSVLIAVSLLAMSSPALASESSRSVEKAAAVLNDPATQNAMAGGFAALLGAMLDIRVDGIAKALEPMNKGKPIKMKGNTLREIAQREEPKFEQKMQNGTRTAVAGMGAMASAMAVMLPQLEEAMGKMGDVLDRLPEAR